MQTVARLTQVQSASASLPPVSPGLADSTAPVSEGPFVLVEASAVPALKL